MLLCKGDYPRQGGYVFVIVCLSLSNFAQNFQIIDLHEIFRDGWQWVNKQMIKFQWQSRTDVLGGRTDIATLVRRDLAGVCTIPVLLVNHCSELLTVDSLLGTLCISLSQPETVDVIICMY